MKIFANPKENTILAYMGALSLPLPSCPSVFFLLFPDAIWGLSYEALQTHFRPQYYNWLEDEKGGKKSLSCKSSAPCTFSFHEGSGYCGYLKSQCLVSCEEERKKPQVTTLYKSLHTMNCRIFQKNRLSQILRLIFLPTFTQGQN